MVFNMWFISIINTYYSFITPQVNFDTIYLLKGADGISIYFLKGHTRMANMHAKTKNYINNDIIMLILRNAHAVSKA